MQQYTSILISWASNRLLHQYINKLIIFAKPLAIGVLDPESLLNCSFFFDQLSSPRSLWPRNVVDQWWPWPLRGTSRGRFWPSKMTLRASKALILAQTFIDVWNINSSCSNMVLRACWGPLGLLFGARGGLLGDRWRLHIDQKGLPRSDPFRFGAIDVCCWPRFVILLVVSFGLKPVFLNS